VAELSRALKMGNRPLELFHGAEVSCGPVRRMERWRRSGWPEEKGGGVTPGMLRGPHMTVGRLVQIQRKEFLQGWGSLPLPNYIFAFPRVLVSHVLDFSFQSNEGGKAVTFMDQQ
jgi:hypothetical protein